MSLETEFTVNTTAKTVTHSSGTEVYTVLAFFQWLAAKFAATAFMDDDFPFVSDTPQVYRWTNGWDMGDETSYQFLKGGAVTTSDYVVDVSGKVFANLYTIGSQFRNSMIYIVQNDAEITPYWIPGNIDILIKIRDTGALIDSGIVTVFSRDTDGLFDHNEADLSAGGRNPAGVNTAEDLNYKTTGDIYLDVAAVTEVRTISGNTVADPTVVTTGTHNLVTGNIVTISGSNSTPTIDGVRTVTVISPTTFSVPVAVTVAGTAGSVTTAFDIGNFAYGAGGASGRIQYIDSTNGYLYLCQVEGTFVAAEVVKERSTRGAGDLGCQTTNHATVAEYSVIKGYSDIKALFVQRKFSGGTSGGDWVVGETVTQAVSGWTGKFIAVVSNVLYAENTSGTPNGTNQLTGATGTYTPTATSAQTTVVKDLNNGAGAVTYNVVIDGAGRTVLQIYQYLKYVCAHNSALSVNGDAGEEYLSASEPTYAEVKQAPFGSFAGGTFFGARGVWVEDYAVASFQLTDATGTQQVPPNYKKANVSHASLVGCYILIAARTGASLIKNQYTISSVTTNSITATASIDGEKAPQSGNLRVGDTVFAYTSFSGAVISGVTPDPTGQTGAFYIPQLDVLADTTTEESDNIILATAFDVKIRVRKYGFKDYTVDGSFPTSGLNVVPILATDPQAS